jgi:hypothetical protein
MQHLSEARLVAHHYGDEAARERTAAEEHLAACPECSARLAGLRSFLGALAAPEVPERGETYGAEVWNSIRAHLPEPREKRWFSLLPQRWALGGALAALLLAAFLLGRFLPPAAPPPIAEKPAQPSGQVRERVLLVALGDHMEKSQMVLVEIANAGGTGPVDISAEQARAEDLVDASRLYRQTAQSVGDTSTAKLLEELERTLLDIAHSPAQLDQADLKRIQQRIESQGLIFKVRVIGAKVQRGQQPQKRSGMENESTQSQPRKQI